MGRVAAVTEANVRRAAELLRSGALVCLPTETVYGLAADAENPAAVAEIFRVKGRPPDHPLIVHLPAVAAMERWVEEVPAAARDLADRFWPGPLTLVLRRSKVASNEVTGGQDTVALRVPAHPVALQVLAEFGGAIAAPSANRFGRISPTRAEHVLEELGEEVAIILDGGPTQFGVESTIVDLSDGSPRLLRPGGVPRASLVEALGAPIRGADDGTGPRAPGRLASHYAPASPVELVGEDELGALLARWPGSSVLSRRPAPPEFGGRWLQLAEDASRYARDLYAALRELDELGERILVELPPLDPEWEAINDRLARAGSRFDGGRGEHS